MTDLDDLKDAMHSTPGFEPRPLDLGAVMAQGGRLRRRRRLAMGAASSATVLVLLVGGGVLARARDGGAEPAPGPVAAAPSTAAPSGAPSATARSTAEPPTDVLGDVIDTGLRTPGGEPVLLWFTPLESESLPRTTFGLTTGRRTPDGVLQREVLTNESEGSDRAPGFHSPHEATEVDGFLSPAFGYFVGADVARIRAMAGGKAVYARLARWSDDPSVVAFWFDPADAPPGKSLTRLFALDAQGRPMPTRDVGFGVG
ncbi:hypothetical protein [Couchioplanes azureus]|uniref:hypothetical protein n=1 Tax=Couchioplanes caeruleus TaxID=56438 RepID=UPI00167091F6|nr:hypothetical protein [Couchioplanes caeruleus]GGQ55143.1 hypothetical protein GCM10010166_25330 [Couchioplanes caeruleus subsp. azureus]